MCYSNDKKSKRKRGVGAIKISKIEREREELEIVR